MTYILSFPKENRISEYILNPKHLPKDAQLVWLKRKKISHVTQHILLFIRTLAIHCFGIRLFSKSFFTDETLQQLDMITPSDRVILFDVFNAKIQRLVSQQVNSKQIHIFLWDCMTEFFFSEKKAKRKADAMLKLGHKIYTYSPVDAELFGFQLVPQVYTSIDPASGNKVSSTDILFVGKDRRRYKVIHSIIERIKAEGIPHSINIMVGKYDKVEECLKPYYFTDRISYPDMLDLVKASQCLLEVIRGDNSGVTLRTMEALVYDKKLITTNKHIVKAPFYNTANIYVWGVDKRSIASFLSEPHQPVSEQIKSQFYLENWIELFQ